MIKKNLLIGPGLGVFLFGLSFVLYLNFSYLGATDKEVESLIFNQFKWLLILINLKILLAYIIIGLIAGTFSLLLKIEKIYNILLFMSSIQTCNWWYDQLRDALRIRLIKGFYSALPMLQLSPHRLIVS